MVNHSREIGNRIIYSMVAAAAGSVLYVTTFGVHYSDITTVIILLTFGVLFGGGFTAMAVYSISFMRIGRPNTRVVKVESKVPGSGFGRLWIKRGKNVKIGSLSLSRSEWRLVAESLAANNWHWSRSMLEEVRANGKPVIKSLSRNWKSIDDDFVFLELIDGEIPNRSVNDAGQEAICGAANLDHLI